MEDYNKEGYNSGGLLVAILVIILVFSFMTCINNKYHSSKYSNEPGGVKSTHY